MKGSLMHSKLLRAMGALLVPFALCACSAVPASPVAAPQSCDAQAVQSLIGKLFAAELQAHAQQLSGARSVRVIRPGQAVTMDYSGSRLNIELDASGRVVRVHCG